MKSNLAILLATYNSQKFLVPQLESLYNQTDREWDLYIRDDGSTDETLAIVKQYQQRYNNIILMDDKVKALGAMKSFLALLTESDSKYYMFCDHDDVWLQDKIEISKKAIIKAEMENPAKPIIVHTDLTVVNDKLEVISNSFWKMSAIKPGYIEDEKMIQVFNCVTGCTMIFNNRAKNVAFPYVDSAPMHDWWIALQTLRHNGLIKHINKPTVLYRQHGNNEVGARDVKMGYFFKKIQKNAETFRGHIRHIHFLKKLRALMLYNIIIIKLSTRLSEMYEV